MNNDEAILFLDASCRVDFLVFAQKAFEVVEPGVKLEWNWHLDCLCDHMQALYEDKLPEGKTRLCINVPPRSLKSFLTSIAFPAWVIGRDASKKFICTSFGFSLAKEMSQKSRIIFESDWYKRVFPNVIIDNAQNEKHNFWTTKRGMYYSSAILSITGRGADYVILDDPINPKEAFSETIRHDTNSTIRSTIPTRFNGLADVVVGAYRETTGTTSGAVYVLFGKNNSATIDVTNLGDSGYKIYNSTTSSRLGTSVSQIGDLNGDGLGDLLISGPTTNGRAYVVYGKTTTTDIDLANLTASQGFTLTGPSCVS